jgi:hypothetical protein
MAPTRFPSQSSGTPSLMPPSFVLTHLVYNGFAFSKYSSSYSEVSPVSCAILASVSGFGAAPRALDACGLSCKVVSDKV